jgi:5'-nucleotidase
MNDRPILLLSNDDGYMAPGLRFLIDVLRPLADVLVVAPKTGQSGMSTAITVTTPLDLVLVSKEPGLTIYRSNGTPVDCIKLALNQLFKDKKPDALFSGVNHGTNSSVAIHYSGTLGAVLEGCMNGVPAVGFSLDDHAADPDFEPSRGFIHRIAEAVLQNGLPEGICLNVNIPKVPELKGIRLCRQARGKWVEEFDIRKHPRGGEYYWLMGRFQNDEPEATDTDMCAMGQGYVSVVPSQIDVTAYPMLETMKSWDL